MVKTIIVIENAKPEELKRIRDLLETGIPEVVLTNQPLKLYRLEDGELFEVVDKLEKVKGFRLEF